MTGSAAAEQALQQALSRVAADRLLRTDGALTVAGLSAEAGVSRSTANRASSVVSGLRALRPRPDIVAGVVGHAWELRTDRDEIQRLRQENAEKVASLEASADTLDQQVEVLTLDNQRLHNAVANQAGLVSLQGAQR